MMTTPHLPGMESLVAPFKFPTTPHEYKVTPLRECPTPDALQLCDTPQKAAAYWRLHIATHPFFNPECECLAVLMLNTRHRIKGHCVVSIGTLDSVLAHPRDIYRLAVVASAHSIVLMHNHPSGESSPSTADIRMTTELVKAGELLKIPLIDHVIVGNGNESSLRSLGYF